MKNINNLYTWIYNINKRKYFVEPESERLGMYFLFELIYDRLFLTIIRWCRTSIWWSLITKRENKKFGIDFYFGFTSDFWFVDILDIDSCYVHDIENDNMIDNLMERMKMICLESKQKNNKLWQTLVESNSNGNIISFASLHIPQICPLA